MKLPAFDYAAPTSIAEAVQLLAANPGAKALAGGQSLIPALAFRLGAPPLLVDLRKVRELSGITIDAAGVRLGARVRWRDIEDEARLKTAHPLLLAAVKHVAHYQVRNRGTVGGSLAHADPAAELPGVAVTCDAQIVTAGAKGSRTLAAADFFTGALSTELADDELIVELRLPSWPRERRWAFEEFSRRRGDFALAAVAVCYDVDGDGKARHAHIGVIGACLRPHRVPQAEALLNGRRLDADTVASAVRAFEAALEPPSDLHASADYRRSLAGTLLERALMRTL
ncbi:MAG: xanthine dehydrogenase family protein subunit M [Betaproteobacteria bacterium]|nr:MAG: xanthine dehydrogenase family protein subunit M [Betaproteobacteria bacterium]